MLDIRFLGDPVLRRHTAPVKRFDAELARFADEMLDTMYARRGVGLAAPQVGVLKRLFVMDVSEDHDDPIVLVNPRIIRRAGEETDTEGCLSIPTLQIEVSRAREIEVSYQDVEGHEQVLRGKGLLARVVQHENDHLDGRLLVDFMTPEERTEFETFWPAILERELARRAAGLHTTEDGEVIEDTPENAPRAPRMLRGGGA